MPKTVQQNAIDLLKEDHRRVQELFSRFDATTEDNKRRRIAKEAIDELTSHTLIEEEILYPTCREALGSDDLVNEMQEAHHVFKIVMTELRLMPAGPRFNAKFRTMAKTVTQHIQEEENDLFPRLQGSTVDLELMARQMRDLRSHRAARALAMATSPSGMAVIATVAAAVAAGVWLSARDREERSRWSLQRK